MDPQIRAHHGQSGTHGSGAPNRAAPTGVARLTGEPAILHQIADAISDCFETSELAASIFETADEHWCLAVYFNQSIEPAALRQAVTNAAGPGATEALTFETLPADDWVRTSLAGLTPVEVGRFVVHGAHSRARVRTNQVAVQVEASLAFGTGHHGSTRGCLIALDRLLKAHRHPGRTPFARKRRTPNASRLHRPRSARPALSRAARAMLLDVGTGSGVLALAAAKALRRRVLASDIDPRAVAIARENARLNGLASMVTVIQAAGVRGSQFQARAPFALIVANILLEPLQLLATPIMRLTGGEGRVVLSGLLHGQAGAALASYRARGLVLERRIKVEGWSTLILRRPACSRAREKVHARKPGLRRWRRRLAR
ncbi:MAG: 50S ribosomal protein L11 methyltransferase [Xanthobacteraceae bacterium]